MELPYYTRLRQKEEVLEKAERQGIIDRAEKRSKAASDIKNGLRAFTFQELMRIEAARADHYA